MLGAASTLRSTPPRRAVLALALWLATAAAAPPQALPEGFGALKFGSTVAQATAAIPSLQPMGPATPAAGAMPIAYYRAENQSFEDLKPCVATLGFAADHFYEVRLDCGRSEAVAKTLRARFGAPTEDAQFDVWQDDRRTISLNRNVMTFAVADRALTQAVHEMIIQKALSGGGVPVPAAPATPAH